MCMKDLKNFCVYDAPDVNLRNTGMILKQLRLKNNLTVRDLQEFFRFDYPNAIYDWEKGLNNTVIDNDALNRVINQFYPIGGLYHRRTYTEHILIILIRKKLHLTIKKIVMNVMKKKH